jgi:hypothetical protein
MEKIMAMSIGNDNLQIHHIIFGDKIKIISTGNWNHIHGPYPDEIMNIP